MTDFMDLTDRPHFYKLDKDNKPIACANQDEWLHWFADTFNTHHHTAHTTLADGTYVSTIFLGADMNIMTAFHPYAKPHLWETAIARPGQHHEIYARYSSHEDALAGHAKAVWLAENPSAESEPEEPC